MEKNNKGDYMKKETVIEFKTEGLGEVKELIDKYSVITRSCARLMELGLDEEIMVNILNSVIPERVEDQCTK